MQEPGQERNDIAELEALWLYSQGQQHAPQSSPGRQATTSAGQHCHVAWCNSVTLLHRNSPRTNTCAYPFCKLLWEAF